jgi:hypothetical protein
MYPVTMLPVRWNAGNLLTETATMTTRAYDPAFPRPFSEQQPGDHVEFCYAQQGMTMREYYAALAMQGVMAGGLTLKAVLPLKPAEVAEAAFNIADALLEHGRKTSR